MCVALLWLVLCRPAAASHLGRPADRAAHQVSATGLQERWATVGACAGWGSAEHQSMLAQPVLWRCLCCACKLFVQGSTRLAVSVVCCFGAVALASLLLLVGQ
jgi:hypothetical protein